MNESCSKKKACCLMVLLAGIIIGFFLRSVYDTQFGAKRDVGERLGESMNKALDKFDAAVEGK